MTTIYEVERIVFARHKAANEIPSVGDVRKLIERLADQYGVEPCDVARKRAIYSDVTGNRVRDPSGYFYYPTARFPAGRITLGSYAPMWVAIHEIAHWLDYTVPIEVEGQTEGDTGHGRRFVSWYATILAQELSSRLAGQIEKRWCEALDRRPITRVGV